MPRSLRRKDPSVSNQYPPPHGGYRARFPQESLLLRRAVRAESEGFAKRSRIEAAGAWNLVNQSRSPAPVTADDEIPRLPGEIRQAIQAQEEDLQSIASKEQKHFPYDALAAATNKFSQKNKLGEGGFGPVYKGTLKDGREVAVKKLSRGSRQGAKEFMNEAMLLSRVQHKNVVNLHGYCTASSSSAAGDGHEEKLLVYEYVPHESLDKYLFRTSAPPPSSPALPFGISINLRYYPQVFVYTQYAHVTTPEDVNALNCYAVLLLLRGVADAQRRRELDWKKRHDIILGVARGLLYLHEDAHTIVIHRDIKASNILLDDKWAPKIADFGMARLFPEDQTHINTRVAGTNGYMAPEYVMHGQLSTKADVFSFGVLVLELISGQRNSAFIPQPDAQSLPEWAWRLHRKKQSMDLMDEALWPTAVREQVEMCMHVGLLCTQADPKTRPDMRRVVVILSKRPSTLEEPSKPGYPGSRYRRSHGPRSSAASGESSSGSTSASASGSSFPSASNPHTATTSTTTRSARLRSLEKRPMVE
ncbi:hypothetical protein Taro_015001 [Colocasia esculenta]|uniref:Protein kinase domain-containing protein n=1 Tax=Colocasia esculenta TaxID=4460 RepID=A0A843URV4_COLES|nr:hypothetical protein [Colocasia esculenta]